MASCSVVSGSIKTSFSSLFLNVCRSTTISTVTRHLTPANALSASSSRGRVSSASTPLLSLSKARGQWPRCPRSHTHEVVPPHQGSIELHAALAVCVSSLQLPHRIHDLQLEQISQYVLVTRQQGFTLAWEGGGGSVYIKLSPEFVGTTCGMCGNFNADVQDDLRTSYGKTPGNDIIDGLIYV